MGHLILDTFFSTARRLRGGKFVWWKDANYEVRKNVLSGNTIGNPYKGIGYAWAADLFEYHMDRPGYLFKTFKVAVATTASTDTTIYLMGDGYSHVPEVGNVLMIGPDTATTTGQSGKVTDVTFDEEKMQFVVTVDTALGALTTDDILVEAAAADGTPAVEAAADATVLVKSPNTFIEMNLEMLPTDGRYGITNVQHNITTVSGKRAFIGRMQPLPKYVLALNKCNIDGVFEI